jgi:myo-inositol 2-dehydrogenase/D-chiro-inositol 1-dehydrogenase
LRQVAKIASEHQSKETIVPVRVGFIGAGGIAGAHFDTLSQISDAQMVAFCDVATERAEAAARRFEGKAYSDARKMLELETLDAVYVCLPPHAHKNAEILVAQKGCALFVEKPLANSMRTAEKIAAAVQDAKILTSVGYHFRYFDATERLRRMLNVKGAPEVAMTNGYWLGGFPGVSWWRRLDQSGGQLVEQCTHIVDLARCLVGDIRRVYCRAAQRAMHKQHEDSTVPDVTALTVEYSNGAVGNFQTAALLGSVGQTGLDLMAHNTLYELRGNTLTVRGQGDITHTYGHSNNAYLEEDRAFIKAVKTGKRAGIKSTYADALKTLEVTLAANQSARSGKPVTLSA